jgi:predicted TIM-barrel fold metal-dependent hydrolase
MRRTLALMALLVGCSTNPVTAKRWQEEPTGLKYSRNELHSYWRQRIQGMLDRGKIPLIDMESSIREQQLEDYLGADLKAMDQLGVALIAFDGHQAKRTAGSAKGYRPSFYTNQLVNAYPQRFIPTTNGGTNKNWFREKDSFVEYLMDAVASQQYSLMGELEFRHYQSNRQCRQGRYDRDIDISLLSDNGRAVFSLSNEIGIPVVIHLEAEDTPLEELETVLQRYPQARVIVAHFGQIRHPDREQGFTPQWVRRMLSSYPNLYYDLSVGKPGRRYACNNVLDTVLWTTSANGQTEVLDPQWQAILSDFSKRFVAGTDYGGGRPPLDEFLAKRVANLRLILSQLPSEAQHDIGYRNAWRLLTGKPWVGRER